MMVRVAAIELSDYHQQVAARKRAAILSAATRLFLGTGYDKTSLARVAEAAEVSTATLYKQFPNKAKLFEAIVVDYWTTSPDDAETIDAPTAEQGLRRLGTRYAALLARDAMADLFRMVIAEAPRFPELARIQFDLGKAPFFEQVRMYLEQEHAQGRLAVDDTTMAATQFLGMISNYVLWPRLLLTTWSMTVQQIQDVVESAVATMIARYRPKP